MTGKAGPFHTSRLIRSFKIFGPNFKWRQILHLGNIILTSLIKLFQVIRKFCVVFSNQSEFWISSLNEDYGELWCLFPAFARYTFCFGILHIAILWRKIILFTSQRLYSSFCYMKMTMLLIKVFYLKAQLIVEIHFFVSGKIVSTFSDGLFLQAGAELSLLSPYPD